MKKIIMIALSIIVTLGIVFVATGLIITKGKNINIFAEEELIEQKIDETATVTSLKLSITSDNVELYLSEDDKLHLEYWEGEFTSYRYSINEGIAELKQQTTLKSWWQFRRQREKTLKVYIPQSLDSLLSIKMSSGSLKSKDYVCNVETLKIIITSGKVFIEQGTIQKMEIEMTSGNIKLAKIEAEYCDANLSSGDFTLADSQVSQNLNLELTSGDISIDNCDINALKLNVTSGSTNLNEVSVSSIDCRTTSGDITFKLKGESVDYSIEIELTSGNALLSIGNQKMTSGNKFSWGSGANPIYCKSTSGSVKIYFDN